MYTIGLDFGTTNIKALICDESGTIVRTMSSATPIHYLPKGFAEFHPDEVFTAVKLVLGELIASFDHPESIAALSFASMAESGVALDRSLKPLAPSIAWFDQRTVPVARRLADRVEPFEIYRITGLNVSHVPSLCKIIWEREHLHQTHKDTHRWAFLCNYLIYRLTGELKTDPTQACRSMAYDINALDWSETLCSVFDIDPVIFPPLVNTGDVLGKILPDIADELGCSRGVVVVQGGHDHPCGALSTGLASQGTLCNSSGTVENALTLIGDRRNSRKLFEMGMSCGNYIIPGYTYIQGGLTSAGRSVDWFARNFYDSDKCSAASVYDEMIVEVENVPVGSEALFFIPHLRGSLVPHKFPAARGSFVGLQDSHTRAHLARGIFEGLAMEYRMVIESIEDALTNHFSEVSCFGGGSQNRCWVQIKADVLNRPMKVYKNQENTGLGAAILAGIGSGVYHDWEDARARVTQRVEMVEPDPERAERYESLYTRIYTSLFTHKKGIDTLIEKHFETDMT